VDYLKAYFQDFFESLLERKPQSAHLLKDALLNLLEFVDTARTDRSCWEYILEEMDLTDDAFEESYQLLSLVYEVMSDTFFKKVV